MLGIPLHQRTLDDTAREIAHEGDAEIGKAVGKNPAISFRIADRLVVGLAADCEAWVVFEKTVSEQYLRGLPIPERRVVTESSRRVGGRVEDCVFGCIQQERGPWRGRLL